MEFTQGHEKYAEKCVAMALSSEQDVDKAQSWARLAEQVASVERRLDLPAMDPSGGNSPQKQFG